MPEARFGETEGRNSWIETGETRKTFKEARLLTRPTLAVISPSRPESAKPDSSPWDAPSPKQGRSE